MTSDDSKDAGPVVTGLAGNHVDGTADLNGSGIWAEVNWSGFSPAGDPWGDHPDNRSSDAGVRHAQDADSEMDYLDGDGKDSNAGDNHTGDSSTDMETSDMEDGNAQDGDPGTSGSEDFDLGYSNSEDTERATSNNEDSDVDPEPSDGEDGDADMEDRNSEYGDVDSEDDNSEDSDAGEDDPAFFLNATCRKKQVSSLVRHLCYCFSLATNPLHHKVKDIIYIQGQPQVRSLTNGGCVTAEPDFAQGRTLYEGRRSDDFEAFASWGDTGSWLSYYRPRTCRRWANTCRRWVKVAFVASKASES